MSTKKLKTQILIIGGGIGGLSLAALLGAQGVRVDVVEPYPPESFKKTKRSGRTVALMENSLNIIKACGVWHRLNDISSPIKMMKIMDNTIAGRRTLESEFPASDIDQEQFGYNIPNGHLRAALFEHVSALKTVTLHKKRSLSSLESDPAHIVATLDNGTTIKAALVIGADGRASKTRELAGIKAKTHAYGQSAITCVINHSKAHQNISTEFHTPSGPLAVVPLPGNQSSIVWVEKTARADELTKLKKTEFEATLQAAMHDLLGGITLETGLESWPLSAINADSLTAPRIALIAEAAHVMSPITAQGLNLSLRDVATLAEEIIDALRVGVDPGVSSVLKAYASRRRLDINTRIFGVDTMNRIVSNDIPAVKGLRRGGFKAMEALSPFKRFATQHALAPTIDRSRLAKGEAL